MKLADLQKNWQTFGKTDPFWAVLSAADNKGGKWQADEFFETGRQEIEGVFDYAASLPFPFARRNALDFGCGVGRLTQALAPHFEQVVGVDIAPSMIELAGNHNQFGGKCRYLVNDTDDLGVFPSDSFDFIYSNIVLQHMEPQYSARYIKEFCRVLSPQGLLLFQIPSEPTDQFRRRQRIKRWIPAALIRMMRKFKDTAVMEMHNIKREEVIRLVEEGGGRIVDIQPDEHSAGWVSFRYCVTKDQAEG